MLNTLTQFLHNIAITAPVLSRLVLGAMYIIGFGFLMTGIYRLKHYGDMRTMMSSSAELKTPLLYLFVGTCLVFYPQIVKISLTTVFGTDNLMVYKPSPSDVPETFHDIETVVMLIGLVAFFRGMMMLTKLGNHGSPQVSFGKAITHIFGGICAVNIYGFWTILKNTVGLS
ncbi:MAG: hypothetical protein COV52_08555 [Gammaproteobacteria bacterium CG11_big_fil_rev_8_21_14_0_20_46_22]|nr:MAG: hypothetical protein COW05_01025 [Gammaproteobacteria bacterium CG12_big_fil_rev_8_21_14_0_65_46_12]PIR10543.1 MAG: hypothetical protein COV52_08555 [Gammaproteobacteria bacterium CG11_big_fil_rev_8_21_14_0_20_46_22]